MTLPKLTPTDLDLLVFKRLKAIYGMKGAWAMKDDPAAFTVEWMKMFRYFHPEEMTRGVDIWLTKSKDEWPRPGQLLECIVDSRPKKESVAFVDALDEDACGCQPGCRWRRYHLENGGMRRLQDCQAKLRHLIPVED